MPGILLGEEVFNFAVTSTTWTQVTIPDARLGKGTRVSMLMQSLGGWKYSHLADGSVWSPCPGEHAPEFNGTNNADKDVTIYAQSIAATDILAVTIVR